MKKIKKEFWKSSEGITVLVAFTVGVLIHLFALTNPLHNHDDIAVQPSGFGGGIVLGRWLLEILGRAAESLGLHYNLPTVDGLVFLLLLAVAAGFVVSFFQIKNNVSAAMVGILFVAFPTVTATLYYRYTSPFYGLGVLLAVLAAWVLQRKGCIWSAVLTALSMGIYQAYIPMTIAMFVLRLIAQCLDGETTIRDLIKRGLYDCLALGLGMILYLVCEKAVIAVMDVKLTDYQGISSMGQMRLADLPALILLALRIPCCLPLQDFCGLAVRKIQNLAYLMLGLITVTMIVMLLVTRVKNLWKALAVGVLGILFLISVNFITVMCPDSSVYTLMVYGFVFLGCAPLVIAEQLPHMQGTAGYLENAVRKISAFGVGLLIFGYAYYGNVNDMALHYANRQVENYVSSIITQARMTDGFTPDKQWAFLGQVEDPLLSCAWEEEATYGGNGFTEWLLNEYSHQNWFRVYVGYDLPMVSEEDAQTLAEKESVKAMPCWPSQGSIQIVEDIVVIKFQESH